MTEAEVALNLHAVLERARQGDAVIVEQVDRPTVIIKTELTGGRNVEEAIVLAEAFEAKLGYAPVPDEDFAKDVQAFIDAHREPLDITAWD